MGRMFWTQEGYGYPLFNEHNMENIKKFLLENGNYSENEIQAIKEAKNENDLQEVTDAPVSYIIAAHMNAKESFVCVFEGYDSWGDTDQEQMIGVSQKYSWEIEPEDRISKETANEILQKYANILGITEKPDYFTAEYRE